MTDEEKSVTLTSPTVLAPAPPRMASPASVGPALAPASAASAACSAMVSGPLACTHSLRDPSNQVSQVSPRSSSSSPLEGSTSSSLELSMLEVMSIIILICNEYF